jgi:hypothetical protein
LKRYPPKKGRDAAKRPTRRERGAPYEGVLRRSVAGGIDEVRGRFGEAVHGKEASKEW